MPFAPASLIPVLTMRTYRLGLLLAIPFALPAQSFVRNGGTQPAVHPWSLDSGLVFAEHRGRMVAFLGGETTPTTWEHTDTGWFEVPTPQVPPARFAYAIAYDGTNIVLHGGHDATTSATRGDTWIYNGATWIPMGTSGPGPRRFHAMTYDAQRGRVVMFGGQDHLGAFPSETWEWDGSAWRQAATGGPQSRVYHKMTYDLHRNRVVLFGGAMNPVFYTDLWEFDGTLWSQLNLQAPPRVQAEFVYDRDARRFLVFGGYDNFGAVIETHAFDAALGTWQHLPVAPFEYPFNGAEAMAEYDPLRRCTVVLGEDIYAGSNPEVGLTFTFHSTVTGTSSYAARGAGCAGGRGQVPVLAAADPLLRPLRGAVFECEVTRTGNASAVVLLTGASDTAWAGTPLPLSLSSLGMVGCQLRVSLDLTLPLAVRSGAARLPSLIPPTIARGTVLHQQALTLDASASNGIGGLSNACAATVQ